MRSPPTRATRSSGTSRADLEAAERALASAGIHNAAQEARWLAEASAHGRGPLEALVRRRLDGEPLQYVTGLAGFRYLDLEVGPGVLIPRPETEQVVERALIHLPPRGALVDVGTGSGAIALAVKHERPGARVVATDLSADALAWTRRNASRLTLEIEVLQGDLLAPLPGDLKARVDVVVSNPPYVGEDERADLPREVVEHEPHLALFAPGGGMEVLEALTAAAPDWLAPGGWLVVEIAPRLAGVVRDRLSASGYEQVAIHEDLAGRPRIAEGRLPR